MKNMDEGLIVQKWVLIVRPKYPKSSWMYQPNLSAQSQTLWISMKKASMGVCSPWISATKAQNYNCTLSIFLVLKDPETQVAEEIYSRKDDVCLVTYQWLSDDCLNLLGTAV